MIARSMTPLGLAAARYKIGLETGESLRDLGEALLSENGMDAAVKLAIADDLSMSEVGPIFERVCRELEQPIPALDEAIDMASAAILRDIADDSVGPPAGLQRLMDVIDSSASQDGRGDKTRYDVSESHDLQPLIGAYWGYDELRRRPEELSVDGEYGEEAIAQYDRNVKALACEWLSKHAAH